MILTAVVAHPRKLIRHAVVALLTGATAAGTRVKGTRVEPNKKTELPAISVYTLHEPVDSTSDGTAPRELTRTVRVEIAGWVADTDALPADDAMDDLAEQIEAAMDADRYLGSEAGDSVLEGTEMTVLRLEGIDPVVGLVTLTYAVTYRTEPMAPVLDDFLRTNEEMQIEGAGADNTVSNLFDMPT